MSRTHHVLVLAVIIAAAGTIAYDLTLALPKPGFLFDFAGFEISARAALRGWDPYGVYPGLPTYFWNGQMSYGINLNPPVAVLAFEPLSQFDPETTYHVWYGLSLIVYLASLVLLARAYPRRDWRSRVPWALSVWGLWNTLLLGQVYVVLAALTIGAWLLQERRRLLLAGLLIGVLVAIKPNFAIWPLLLFVAGYRRSALSAAATAGVLMLVPLLLDGPTIYGQWLAVIGTNSLLTYPANGSLFAAAARVGLPRLGPVLSGALVVVLAGCIWRYRPSARDVSALALLGSLLASPIAWAGYALVLMPIFFSRRWSVPLVAAATLWMIPEYLIVGEFRDSGWRLWVFGSLYLVSLLAVLLVIAVDIVGMRARPLRRFVPAVLSRVPAA